MLALVGFCTAFSAVLTGFKLSGAVIAWWLVMAPAAASWVVLAGWLGWWWRKEK